MERNKMPYGFNLMFVEINPHKPKEKETIKLAEIIKKISISIEASE